jgi:hypothetical protein
VINVSPLRGQVVQLDKRWQSLAARAEGASVTNLEKALGWVIDRIDPTSVVLSRIDIDQIIAERIDVEAVVRRVDVVAVARQVIDELDLPEIVRDSSQTMAAETVDGLRRHGMDADRSLAEFIDRVLRRKQGRGPASAGPGSGLGQPI